MTDVEWTYADCPICHQSYPYVKGGYKPQTCSSYECIHQYLHPKIYNIQSKEVMPIKKDTR